MNVDLLERITRLMRDNDLNTVDLRDGDQRVILKRGAVIHQTFQSPGGGAGYAPTMSSPDPSSRSAGSASHPGNSPAMVDSEAGLLPIKSPMVGTFYTSSSPDAKAFV